MRKFFKGFFIGAICTMFRISSKKNVRLDHGQRTFLRTCQNCW